ncbi:MAG: NUDIX hydrolase [Mangrovibacterium sp.]
MIKFHQELQEELYGKYPKHLVAVDNVIFGYDDGELRVLLYPRSFEPAKGNWSLLGGFLHSKESSEEAAARIVQITTGLDELYMEQVQVFTHPNREEQTRVLSIVYYSLIRLAKYDDSLLRQYGAEWFSLEELPNLIFDHSEMIELALNKLRQKASIRLMGSELLADKFTISQLRRLYEAMYNKEFDPGNFRKKVLSLGVLVRLEEKDFEESKKGAYLYRYEEEEEAENEKEIIKVINFI